jgi:N-acetyl-gamma-glutamyl-phosphate reductase
MHKIRTGIIGATGYTGAELVRILYGHGNAEISLITSESRANESFSDIHGNFKGIVDQKLYPLEEIGDRDLDVVFLALPHGVSMDFVREYHDASFRIIDLSGDFRLLSADSYREWYGKEHIFKEGLDNAVFGMPEIYRSKVKEARLIANPGCYPTSSILGIYPLLKEGIIDTDQVIIDSKSGTTGAGVKPKEVTHFSNVNDNFKAYGVKTHRHTIEIQEILHHATGSNPIIQFTPHLLPIDRGILSTIYLLPSKPVSEKDLIEIYSSYYEKEPFIRLREEPPSVKEVRGSNYCDIFATLDTRTGRIITITAIDNLVKGASGQAVQNMNIMFNLDEKSGLQQVPIYP